MRITNSMVMNQYAKQLNHNVEQVSDDTQKLSSGQKYSRASQDPVEAAQMVEINGQLKTVNRYQSNIQSAQSWMTETETVVNTDYYGILTKANVTLNTASSSGTSSTTSNAALAQNLQGYQTDMLSALNSISGGQYVLGGSSTGNPPFKVGTESDYTAYANYVTAYGTAYNTAYQAAYTADPTITDTAAQAKAATAAAADADVKTAQSSLTVAPVFTVSTSEASGTHTATVTASLSEDDINGKLLYQAPTTGAYIPMSKINNSAQTAATTVNDLAYYSTENSAMTRTSPIDLGYGTQMSGGKVVAGTAFEASTNPLDFLLQNVTTSGSQNVYDAFGETANALNQNDTSSVSATFSLNTDAMTKTTLVNTALGAKQNMLTFLSNKYSADTINITQQLSNVEDVDTTTAYTQYSLHLMAYQASLSISSSILQNNLTQYLK